MTNYELHSKLFRALMHPTRLAILDVLREGEQCVCHMEAMLGLRQAHISQHLMVLRDAGLVADRRDGWNIFYRVSKMDVYRVIDAMDALSSTTPGARQGKTPLVAKKACPCPKCNPDSGDIRCDPPIPEKEAACKAA
jgi:ArsR family transcriptional regulator